jgi:PAS domain-containing protein
MAIRAKRIATQEPSQGEIIKATRIIVEHEKAELASKVVEIFEAANFRVVQKMRQGRLEMGDLLVEREELGRDRRYAIELKDKLGLRDANQLLQRFRSHARTSKVPFKEFDEFWVVAQRVDRDARSIRNENSPQFRVLGIDELREILAVARLPKAKQAGKARTRIGKAVEANEKGIQLAIAALILQIEDKLEGLGNEWPNSDEAIAARESRISEYERMRGELENIRQAVIQFIKGKEKEASVVKSVTTFQDGVKNWWNKGHEKILSTTFESSLFVGATSVLHLLNADSAVALAVAGTLIGGETVVKGLKALPRKLFGP